MSSPVAVLAQGTIALPEVPEELPPRPWFQDEHGRHFIPNGVVVNTEDGEGPLHFPPEAYERMRSLGFNFQVVRLALGKLGGWPGYPFRPEYLDKVARLVEMGKEIGLKTTFKMTVYDLGEEGRFTQKDWGQLFVDEETQERYVDAWKRVFGRFEDEPAVFGYDLLNEPIATPEKKRVWEVTPELKDLVTFERDYFIPLYHRVIDVLRATSPKKWALYQSHHVKQAEHIATGFPSAQPLFPVQRERIAFAPHYYGKRPRVAVLHYLEDAATSGAPMIMGEYGPPTFCETDTDLEEQMAYRENLMRSVQVYDRYVLGQVKAWWLGEGTPDAECEPRTRKTWAMFYGDSDALGPERKYILDIVARPRPLNVAGVVHTFGYDFATRHFEMRFRPEEARAPSEIFIPVDRHYPDGFRVRYGDLTLALAPEDQSALQVVENTDGVDTDLFRWDAARQRLMVKRWPDVQSNGLAALQVIPGHQN